MRISVVVLFFILPYLLSANSSIYSKLSGSNCKLIYDDIHSTEHTCPGPKGFAFNILDGGGMQIQFDIKHNNQSFSVWSAKEPKVIEYRLNKQKKVIALIVRIYEYKDVENLSSENTSSKLYVFTFDENIKLLAKVITNEKARALIDKL